MSKQTEITGVCREALPFNGFRLLKMDAVQSEKYTVKIIEYIKREIILYLILLNVVFK